MSSLLCPNQQAINDLSPSRHLSRSQAQQQALKVLWVELEETEEKIEALALDRQALKAKIAAAIGELNQSARNGYSAAGR